MSQLRNHLFIPQPDGLRPGEKVVQFDATPSSDSRAHDRLYVLTSQGRMFTASMRANAVWKEILPPGSERNLGTEAEVPRGSYMGQQPPLAKQPSRPWALDLERPPTPPMVERL